MEKISDQLARLQRIAPKRDAKTGFLFKSADQKKKRYKQVTFHTILVSDENTHMVHSARFKSEEARSPLEWFEWFRGQPGKDQSQTYGTMIETIYARGILSGIETRTSKSWGVQKWIGFSGVAIDLHKPKTAKLDRKRNPSKSQRGARG